MYNRYIPGTNGSYERQTVAEPVGIQSPQTPVIPREAHEPPCIEPQAKPVRSFLQRILPSNLDIGDLLLLCIVLLMLMDSEEDDILSILITVAAFLLLQ